MLTVAVRRDRPKDFYLGIWEHSIVDRSSRIEYVYVPLTGPRSSEPECPVNLRPSRVYPN